MQTHCHAERTKTVSTNCTCDSKEAHQLDEIFSHAFIVLIDSMHNGINERLLVGLTQLGYIAKVHICNPAIWHGKDVAGVGVSMKEPELHSRIKLGSG